MKYYIDCDYDCHTGMDNSSFDDGSYSGYSHEVKSNHRFSVSETKIGYPYATIDTDIKDPLFVSVIYYTGGTFGRSDGEVDILGAISKDQLDEVVELIKSNPCDHKKLGKIFNQEYFYAGWHGYFEGLQNIIVLTKDNFQKSIL